MRAQGITPVAMLLVLVQASVGLGAQSDRFQMEGQARPAASAVTVPNTPLPRLVFDSERTLAALDDGAAGRSSSRVRADRPWSAMSVQAPRPQGGFPSRRRWVLLATAIGAGSGALVGAVAPASACGSTTSINGGPLQCDDRGATIGAFAFGGALGGLLIGWLAR